MFKFLFSYSNKTFGNTTPRLTENLITSKIRNQSNLDDDTNFKLMDNQEESSKIIIQPRVVQNFVPIKTDYIKIQSNNNNNKQEINSKHDDNTKVSNLIKQFSVKLKNLKTLNNINNDQKVEKIEKIENKNEIPKNFSNIEEMIDIIFNNNNTDNNNINKINNEEEKEHEKKFSKELFEDI